MSLPLTIQQRERLREIASRHRLRLIVAFGSAVTGRTHLGSDLDLAVLPADGLELSLDDFAHLRAGLADVFAPAEVDLALMSRADPLFLRKIFETAVLLYGDGRTFRWYRVYAFRRFSEYLPYLRVEAESTRTLVRRLRHAG
ncbi:MAG: nucleotidyltransferase domain-containing protein [Armatimonadota bacterium]|nr:nucleotidyltransferase domain-containing protein [Armatimonadota bacterium]